MIFGVLNPEKIWHQELVHLPTSPVYCSHFTLGNPKKSFFNSIIHTYRLFTLSKKKTNCYPFTHHIWKISPHHLVKCTIFSSDWRYVRSSKRWWIWNEPVVGWHWWLWKEPVVMCGKWNVRQATLQQMFKVTTFCTATCFQSFLSLINCVIHHRLTFDRVIWKIERDTVYNEDNSYIECSCQWKVDNRLLQQRLVQQIKNFHSCWLFPQRRSQRLLQRLLLQALLTPDVGPSQTNVRKINSHTHFHDNIWSTSLPDFIRDPNISADCFRRLLKTYLFARY